ncbi:hypothetical protein D3C72_1412620 [compost metagenome]
MLIGAWCALASARPAGIGTGAGSGATTQAVPGRNCDENAKGSALRSTSPRAERISNS